MVLPSVARFPASCHFISLHVNWIVNMEHSRMEAQFHVAVVQQGVISIFQLIHHSAWSAYHAHLVTTTPFSCYTSEQMGG
jgi:hypothetical protein